MKTALSGQGLDSLSPRMYGSLDRNFTVSLGISNISIVYALTHPIRHINGSSALQTNTQKKDAASALERGAFCLLW